MRPTVNYESTDQTLPNDDVIVASSTENEVTTDPEYSLNFVDTAISAEEVLTTMSTPVWTTTAGTTVLKTTTPNINNSTRTAKWRRRNNPNRNMRCCLVGRKVSKTYGPINCNVQFYSRYRLSLLKSTDHEKLKHFFAATCPADFIECCKATDPSGKHQTV